MYTFINITHTYMYEFMHITDTHTHLCKHTHTFKAFDVFTVVCLGMHTKSWIIY